MLSALPQQLKPLLGQFSLAGEMQFINQIFEAHLEPANYLVYADWLEERGDVRAEFLKLFSKVISESLTEIQDAIADPKYKEAWGNASQAWLCRLFGNNIRRRMFKPTGQGTNQNDLPSP